MQDTLPGSMLSVPLPADQIESLLKLDDNNELSLAAINSTSHCVISGSTRDIARLDNQLKEKGHHCRRLHTSHAFHSKAMDPILKKFEEKIREVTLNQPTFPYISNLTGTWIKKEEAMAPEYWVSHLRNTVRFAHGLAELLKEPGIIFLEVGPGRALSTFVKQHAHKRPDQLNLNLLAPPGEDTEEIKELLHKIGGLWIHGADIDWQGFYLNEKRYRIPLPTYPYERQRFWIDENPSTIMGTMLSNSRAPGKKIDPADWFYIPSWERSILPGLTNDNDLNNEGQPPATALILSGGSKFENRLVEQLKNLGWHIITVLSAYTFKTVNKGIHNYKINPCKSSDYNQLFTALRERGTFPTYIIHLWSITNKQDAQVDKKELSIDRFNKARDLGFYSLLNIVQSIGKQGITSEIQLVAITNNMVEVTGGELLYPEKATILGAVKIIPLEYSNITCRSIDIELPGPGGGQEFRLINQLVKEFSMPIDNSAGNAVAYRGDYRWVPCIKPVRLEKSDNHRLMQRFKNKGVYLISGGFGGMGFTLAQYLAKNFNASLILVGRSGCPGGNPWQKKIKEMEEQGAEIMTAAADVSNLQQMIKVVNQAKKRFGTINGVLHTAGVIDDAGVIQRRTRDMTEKVMAPKVKGTLVLDHILSDMKLDFFVLFSSLGNFLYQIKFGEVGYSAANEFLDAFAYYKKNNSSTLTVTINWDDWQKVGMAIKAIKQEYSFNAQQTDEGGNNNRSNMDRLESQLQDALSPSEGIDVFKRILEHSIPHVLVSTRDLKVIIERMKREGPEEAAEHKLLKIPITPKTSTQRPELSTGYTAPQNKIQQVLVNIFKEFFSYEQVGIDDDFFELGGDSLKAITILNKIHKVLNVKILLAEIFKKNTIRKLSIYISSLTENKYTAVKPVEQKEYYDLSPAQKRLYAFQQIHPQSTAYNMPILIESFKDPDRDKLEDVFKQLIQKHESLRTSFHTLAGQLVQKIHRHVEFSIEYDDKSNEKRADTTEITKDSVKPFDLSLAPLLRVRLIRTGPGKDQHSLMVDIHHNICDGMSLGILTRDFMKLYQGETPTTLTVQYKDYSQWQNSSTMKQLRKKQEAYWYKKFKDNIPALNIPTDYPRPTLQDFEGGSITFRIGKEEASEMHQMALNEDVTMYMLLLAVYTIMLSKLSRQEDIAVGTPMAGRQHPGLERLIGMFVNTLVMRNYPRRYITFREFLKDVKENTLEAFDNQEYYFEDLVSGVVINRDMSRNPLFDVIFNYQVMDIPGNKKSGITRDLYKKINTTSQFDFSFVANEIAGELLITIDYSTKLFKKDTIIRFGSYFQEIISNVLKNEEIKLDDIHISYHLGEARTNLPETRFVF
jgi:malonyl CoA-acyl carrier protein transacylase/acyl carrier protein